MRILIIEDNSKTNEYLGTRLRSLAYAVDSSHDGKEGLYLSKLHSYDAIILDLALPQKNGKDIIRELREDSYTTPIIVISGSIGENDISKLFELGADEVLTKPFNSEELIARLQALLRRQNAPTKKSLSHKNYHLDYGTQTLTCGETMILLTRNEFTILELLIQNVNCTVSRQEIFSYVWETDLPYTSNTVETHILNLRKKIAKLPPLKIETISGRGYILSCS